MSKKRLEARTMLFPTPLVLVTTVDKEGKPNIITVTCVGIASAKPLKMESLEGVKKKKKKKKKGMTKSVAIRLLRSLNPKLTPRLAKIVVDHAARNYPVES